jgi:hypothetical protein
MWRSFCIYPDWTNTITMQTNFVKPTKLSINPAIRYLYQINRLKYWNTINMIWWMSSFLFYNSMLIYNENIIQLIDEYLGNLHLLNSSIKFPVQYINGIWVWQKCIKIELDISKLI